MAFRERYGRNCLRVRKLQLEKETNKQKNG